MKKLFILLQSKRIPSFIYVFFILALLNSNVCSQTIQETKKFISETIINYPPPSYTQSVEFFPENDKILFYDMYVIRQRAHFSYSFDVKGIDYIRDGKEYYEDGTSVSKLVLYIKPNFYMTEIFAGKTKKPESISIYLGSAAEIKRLKKALLHLCVLYGGSPKENELFNN